MANEIDKPYSKKEVLELFGSGSFLIFIGLILCMFFMVCFVNNTEYGIEVSANGFNLAFATISGKFKSLDDIFGNVAIPFYYYAKVETIICGILSLITLFSLVAFVVLSYLNIKKPTEKMAKINMIGSFVIAGLFLTTFVVALVMNASDILPIYCSGNKKCSIGSLSIIPAAVGVGNGFLNYFYGKKIAEFENSPEQAA